MITSETYLRFWQKEGLPTYLKEANQNFSQLTVAYQGTGKTMYTAICYVAFVLNDSGIKDLSLAGIADRYSNSPNKNKFFPIVFVPARSILETTITTWGLLGIKLARIENSNLAKTSPAQLIKEGVDGLICLYQQALKTGESSDTEWNQNRLIGFIKRSPEIKIHATLDECHELTMYQTGKYNKRAKYFVLNQHLFFRLHLVTGTPIKIGFKFTTESEDLRGQKRIPFVKYSGEGDVIPDTHYSQESAIHDKVIVQTKVVIHPVSYSNVEIEGNRYSLTASDIEWWINNNSTYAASCEEHPNYNRLHQINAAFSAIYNSVDIWKHLMVYGDSWLSETRKIYPNAKGIIFAPGRKSATNIHKQLIKDRSVLCIGEPDGIDLSGCNFVKSHEIKPWLKNNEDSIDWIVSCEALMQGFDHPNCKVSIITPQLKFLHLIKIAQIMGRTNRTIQGYPDLKATCLILDCKPINELVKLSQFSKFGICDSSIVYTDNILDVQSSEAIKASKNRIKAKEKGQEIVPKDIKIHDLMMSNITRLVTENGEVFYNYSPQIKSELTKINIQSYWTHWGTIVNEIKELLPSQIPPHSSGVYIIANAKTTEILYVGQADNLFQRVSGSKRYENLPWLTVEGSDNLFVRWIVCGNYSDQEALLIHQLKPKYNKQRPSLPSHIAHLIHINN